jgi:O-antigen/teichoic acid export membrane protein
MAIEYSNMINSPINFIWIKKIVKSPAVFSTVIFTVSGILFAVSNLILARFLPKTEYGIFLLFFTFVQLGIFMGPIGIEVIVNRHKLHPDLRLLYQVFITASIIGGFIVTIGGLIYNLKFGLLIVILISIVSGSGNRLAAAHCQSMQRFGLSLCFSQNQNIFLLIAALITMFFGLSHALIPCSIVGAGYMISASTSWVYLLYRRPKYSFYKQSILWREALTILTLNGAMLMMMHIERLAVPKVLSMETLATLGILMIVAGSPYRMLQLGVHFTILPRFRDAGSAKQRKKLLLKEGSTMLFTAIIASIAVWFLAPIIVKWFLSGKYYISQTLIMATIVIGFTKIFDAFASTAVTSVSSSRELGILSFSSWMALCISIAGVFIGARWDLLGVIYGVGIGWFLRVVISSILSIKYFRSSNPINI